MNLKLKMTLKSACFISVVLVLALTGCRDDVDYYGKDCPEGEPATISLEFNAPERDQYTRSNLSEEQDNQVNSIWLGIYAENGDCTTNLYIAAGDYGFKGNTGTHNDIILSGIPTQSGNCRIVAVANPDNHLGRKIGDAGVSDLTQLLHNANTWDDYLKISVALDDPDSDSADIQTPLVSDDKALVMSGSFVPSSYDNHDPNMTWSNDLLNQTVSIYPGATSPDGKVHLRRLVSHIVFNLEPEGDIVDIEPISWQVNNAPVYSWIHERTDYGNFGQEKESSLQATNAGDAMTPQYIDNQNYKPSLIYTSTDFSKESLTGDTKGRNRFSFDFWMYENKRRGTESCTDYQKRELEYGGAIGSLTDPDPTGSANSNMSGVFVSLTGKDNVTLNNKATYVDIPCEVTYIVKTDNENSGANAGEGIDVPEGATRTAYVTYRVHLGFTGGSANADPKDFNSFRNSSYTYTLKIKSLKNVVVEAFRKGDNQPGGFGTVTDVTDRYYDLDAHYNAFNIHLSDDELKTFSFSMVSYENGVPHEIHGGLEKGSNIPSVNDPDYKYYSWIELLPTDDEATLRSYPGTTSTNLLRLGDFLPKSDGIASRAGGWYTVFVNEYVYETSSDESISKAWKGYANQPNRNVWINVTEHVSADGASMYYKAKYAFSQKSIQTYYSTSTTDNQTALGMEHENENFGMNIRWTTAWDVGTGENNLDNENGRWNAWLFASSSKAADENWDKAVNFTTPQVINNLTNTNQTFSYIYPDRDLNKRTETVPSIVLLSGLSGREPYDQSATVFDPQIPQSGGDVTIQYYQGYYACMNRNRDLNGDNKITPDEIRWYLPTSGQMLRLILGRNGLKTPIMGYPNKDLPQGSGQGFDVLFHYLTSDHKIIWTEEGMSSSEYHGTGNAQYRRSPWDVRCIRNLGTNLGEEVARGNRVDVAYKAEVDATTKGGVVKPTHYYGSALRNPSTGPVPIHKTNDPLNRLAQYGFEIAPRGNKFNAESYPNEQIDKTFYYTEVGSSEYDNPSEEQYLKYVDAVNNTLCRSLDESTGRSGWRVPTQKEIIIMLRTTDENGDRILERCDFHNAYFCVTQEYWENTTGKSSPSMTPGANYRFCTVSEDLAEAKNLGRLDYLRCVRDLSATEAKMSYKDIVSQTRKRPKKRIR